MILVCFTFLGLLLAVTTHAFYTVGFKPQLSSACSADLVNFLQLVPATNCNNLLTTIYNNSDQFSICSEGKGGVNCFDVQSVVTAAEQAKYLVPAYRLPNKSSCSLCTPSAGMIGGCSSLIDLSLTLVYGNPLDIVSLHITNATVLSALHRLENRITTSCSAVDKSSLHIFKYQAQLLCDSTNVFNRSTTVAGTLSGVLDMRPLTQCGTCAVLPCLPGQYCDGTGAAMSCPESYYCPSPTEKITCPSGYFCPVASTSPKKCRDVAAGSCDAGSAREVVWVPLFIACIFLMTTCSFEYILNIVRKSPNSEVKVFEYIRVPVSHNAMQFSTQTAPVSIEFKNLVLVSGHNTRVSDVSGIIKPGRFTAILGGSGAGKTSLMNVILGREALTSGEVSFVSDSRKIHSHLLDRIVAFVPQNEIYLREMTVEELVLHSARWRLPCKSSDAKIRERVEEVLSQLQLQHLRHVTVGGADQAYSKGESMGLSPGDRKKVNIALELVAGPNVLFLDEPTTGIDSSSALNVAKIVHNLAKTGLTCVAVIHQPRSEIFSLIDDMIILVRGGKVAYQGPTKCVMQYFATFGLTLPNAKANKTDFLIDITSKHPPSNLAVHSQIVGSTPDSRILGLSEGDVEMESGPTQTSCQTWSDLWDVHGKKFLDEFAELEGELDEAVNREISIALPMQQDKKETSDSGKSVIVIDEPRKGFFPQLSCNFERGIRQHFKNRIYANDALIHFVAGIIMGIATSGGPLFINAIAPTYNGSCPQGSSIRCNSWLRFEIAPATFLMTMILGAITIPGAVRTFGREKEVFARESSVGANKFAYFCGKICSDAPFLAFNVFIFMSPIIAIAPWQCPVDKLYGMLLCIGFVVSCMGYWLSVLFADPDAAVLTGVILSILLNLFSGFVPKLGDSFLGLIMYTRWSARALVTAELKYGYGMSNDEDFNQVVPENWKDPDFGYDCGILVLIGAVMLFLSYCFILYKNRRISNL